MGVCFARKRREGWLCGVARGIPIQRQQHIVGRRRLRGVWIRSTQSGKVREKWQGEDEMCLPVLAQCSLFSPGDLVPNNNREVKRWDGEVEKSSGYGGAFRPKSFALAWLASFPPIRPLAVMPRGNIISYCHVAETLSRPASPARRVLSFCPVCVVLPRWEAEWSGKNIFSRLRRLQKRGKGTGRRSFPLLF